MIKLELIRSINNCIYLNSNKFKAFVPDFCGLETKNQRIILKYYNKHFKIKISKDLDPYKNRIINFEPFYYNFTLRTIIQIIEN